MIRVQREDFDAGAELKKLGNEGRRIGGIAAFVGVVRGSESGEAIEAMTLEHYPGMTEAELARIEAEARARWPLEEVIIIHRHGRLKAGENIVLVIAASSHRQAAFEACAFVVDFLKTKAPFWKLEERGSGAKWVEAQASDDALAEGWRNSR